PSSTVRKASRVLQTMVQPPILVSTSQHVSLTFPMPEEAPMAIGSHVSAAPDLGAEILAKLQGRLQGELVRPGVRGYDTARAICNAMIDKHPAPIVRCKAVSDVQHALEFGRRHNLAIAVRGGGHNVAGKALCDDGLVIDLSPMKEADLNPGGRTIQAEAGF